MMGHRQVEPAALFYEFSLERHIPADHLLRSIDGQSDLFRCVFEGVLRRCIEERPGPLGCLLFGGKAGLPDRVSGLSV